MRYEIEQMLWNLGAHPDKPGYEQAIRLLELMIDRPIVQNISSFYQLSSQAQGIHVSKIEKSVRDMIHNSGKPIPFCRNSSCRGATPRIIRRAQRHFSIRLPPTSAFTDRTRKSRNDTGYCIRIISLCSRLMILFSRLDI